MRRHMIRKTWSTLAGAALLLIGLSAQAAEPLLWRVEGAGDGSVHLLGSMHVLTPEDYPLPAKVEQAFAEADLVVFELDPAEAMSPAMAGKLVQAGMLTGSQTLRDLVAAPTWEALTAYGRSSGTQVAMFERMKPWLAALIIVMGESQKAGFRPDLGLDQHLMRRALEAGKRTAGLERADAQIGLFDNLSPKLQEAMLAQTLEKAGEPDGVRRLHTLWRDGDSAGLAAYVREEFAEYPEINESININRNRQWLGAVREFAGSGKKVLVVVGALHLVGEDGVPAQLRQAGMRVERIGCTLCR
jgi:uncharacterized protein